MKSIDITFPGGKKVAAHIAGHVVMTDQPYSNGGENTAPSPFDLFFASLATCAGFYASAFCTRRNISMHGLTMRMLCHEGERSKMYDKVVVEMILPEDFPRDQVEPLKRSVDSCTVRKHIVTAPAFEILIR